MSSLTDKNQGHQNPGQNQQGQTQGQPIRQDEGRDTPDPKPRPSAQPREV